MGTQWELFLTPTVHRTINKFLNIITSAEHAMSTRLCDVGQQVWRGALLLSDFIFHQNSQFTDTVVLELGCGVGLVSIVASHFCSAIFCTGK